jgi:hypothetical protein
VTRYTPFLHHWNALIENDDTKHNSSLKIDENDDTLKGNSSLKIDAGG